MFRLFLKLSLYSRFDEEELFICPPAPKRCKDSDLEATPIDKVRSALGNAYSTELHFAIAHFRRIDGAYPPQNEKKALNLLETGKGPRYVPITTLLKHIF